MRRPGRRTGGQERGEAEARAGVTRLMGRMVRGGRERGVTVGGWGFTVVRCSPPGEQSSEALPEGMTRALVLGVGRVGRACLGAGVVVCGMSFSSGESLSRWPCEINDSVTGLPSRGVRCLVGGVATPPSRLFELERCA